MGVAALLLEGRPRRSILHHLSFMPSDPRCSLRLSREFSYGSRERLRDDDLYAEHSFFRKGYDPIGRLCMRMRPRHAGNMAWRALIGNPGGKGAPTIKLTLGMSIRAVIHICSILTSGGPGLSIIATRWQWSRVDFIAFLGCQYRKMRLWYIYAWIAQRHNGVSCSVTLSLLAPSAADRPPSEHSLRAPGVSLLKG